MGKEFFITGLSIPNFKNCIYIKLKSYKVELVIFQQLFFTISLKYLRFLSAAKAVPKRQQSSAKTAKYFILISVGTTEISIATDGTKLFNDPRCWLCYIGPKPDRLSIDEGQPRFLFEFFKH